ncbi:2623_t:CDS:2, partial [Gigaspora margarita]
LFKTLYLQINDNDDVKKDFNKLNNRMLKNYEWELLEELVEIFKPFDDLTTYFSRAQYTTLLVVNPSIKALKFEYADGDLIKENFNDEVLLEEDFSNDDLDDNEELFEPQAVTSKLRGVIYNSL